MEKSCRQVEEVRSDATVWTKVQVVLEAVVETRRDRVCTRKRELHDV